ncbi:hypothetical protein GMSM_29730 [Geomonas sp. Red276]
MKDNNKIIQEVLKDLLVARMDLQPGEFLYHSIEDVNSIKRKFTYTFMIRSLMQKPSSIPLSIEKLGEIKFESNELVEKYNYVDNIIPIKGKLKASFKDVMRWKEEKYINVIRKDVENHVNMLVESELALVTGTNEGDSSVHNSIGDVNDEYLYYLKHVFKYQLEFALRTKNITGQQLGVYTQLADPKNIDSIVNDMLFTKAIPFTFNFNPLKPLEISLKEVEAFKADLELFMECHAACMKKLEYLGALIDYPKDVDGRFKYRKNLQKLFETWQRYLDAYDYNESGVSLEEIYKRLHGSKVVSDSDKIIKSYLGYARRYIAAVESGTFPHIE